MAATERRLIHVGVRPTMTLCCLWWWLIGAGAFANVVTREYPEETKIDKLHGRPNIDADELIGGHPYAEMDTFRRNGGHVRESHPPNGYGGPPPPPPASPHANRPTCEHSRPYSEPYHHHHYHQEPHHQNYGGHKSSGYYGTDNNNNNYGYVKEKNYGLPSYPHHKKHPAYGGGNNYANIEHHSSSYEYGGGGDGGAHYDNSYGGGGYGNEGYDHYHGDGEYAHSHERGYGSGGGTDDHYYGKKEHHHHRPNSDTNVYDVVVKSKETVEDVYDQKALKHNHHHVDLSDLIFPLHIPHPKSSYGPDYGESSSPTAGYDQPYAYGGHQGGQAGTDKYQKPSSYGGDLYSKAPSTAAGYAGQSVGTALTAPQSGRPPAADHYRRQAAADHQPLSTSTTILTTTAIDDEASSSATTKPLTVTTAVADVPHFERHRSAKNEKDLLVLHEKILGGTPTNVSSNNGTNSSVMDEESLARTETASQAGRSFENVKEVAGAEPVKVTTANNLTFDAGEHVEEDVFPVASDLSNYNGSEPVSGRLRNDTLSAERVRDEDQQAKLGEVDPLPSASEKAVNQGEEVNEATEATDDAGEHVEEDVFPVASDSSNYNGSEPVSGRLRDDTLSAERVRDKDQQAKLGEVEPLPSASEKAVKQGEEVNKATEATDGDKWTFGSSGEEETVKPFTASNKAEGEQKPVETEITAENFTTIENPSDEPEEPTSEAPTALKNAMEDTSSGRPTTPAQSFERMNPLEMDEEAATEPPTISDERDDEKVPTELLTTLRDVSEKLNSTEEDEERNSPTISDEFRNPVKEAESNAEISGAFSTSSSSLTEDGIFFEEAEKSSSMIPVKVSSTAEEDSSKPEEIVESSIPASESSTEASESTSDTVKTDESVSTINTAESEDAAVEQGITELASIEANEKPRSGMETPNGEDVVSLNGAAPSPQVWKRNVTAAAPPRPGKRKPFEPEPMAGANFARR